MLGCSGGERVPLRRFCRARRVVVTVPSLLGCWCPFLTWPPSLSPSSSLLPSLSSPCPGCENHHRHHCHRRHRRGRGHRYRHSHRLHPFACPRLGAASLPHFPPASNTAPHTPNSSPFSRVPPAGIQNPGTTPVPSGTAPKVPFPIRARWSSKQNRRHHRLRWVLVGPNKVDACARPGAVGSHRPITYPGCDPVPPVRRPLPSPPSTPCENRRS